MSGWQAVSIVAAFFVFVTLVTLIAVLNPGGCS